MKQKTDRWLVILMIATWLFVAVGWFVYLTGGYSQAADIAVDLTRQIPTSENFGPLDGLKISVRPEGTPFYVWLSGEFGSLSLVAQPFEDVFLFGAGAGYRKKFDGITLFIELGYFHPEADAADKTFYHAVGGYDKIYLHLNEKYAPIEGRTYFDTYEMHIRGNFGGAAGIKYHYKSFSVIAGYRMLSLRLQTVGRWTGNSESYWNRTENENLSGPFIGIGWTF